MLVFGCHFNIYALYLDLCWCLPCCNDFLYHLFYRRDKQWQ